MEHSVEELFTQRVVVLGYENPIDRKKRGLPPLLLIPRVFLQTKSALGGLWESTDRFRRQPRTRQKRSLFIMFTQFRLPAKSGMDSKGELHIVFLSAFQPLTKSYKHKQHTLPQHGTVTIPAGTGNTSANSGSIFN